MLTEFLHINTETFSWKAFQSVRTFILFSMGIMMTSVRSLYEIKVILYNIIFNFAPWSYFDGSMYEIGLDKTNFNIACISLIMVWSIGFLQEKYGDVRQQIAGLNAPVRWMLYAISITAIIFVGIYGVNYNTAGFAYTHF